MTHETLTRKALNRALLARQMLLAREELSANAAIERLVGLQAQQARPPFVGLWSRIAGFERDELRSLLESRQVVRATLMRCTLHLMSRSDYRVFRPMLQPALTIGMRAILGDRTKSFPFDALLAEAQRLFEERPRTFIELRAELLKRFPDADERAMGYAVRTHLPLIVVPCEHEWGFRADAAFGLADEWRGRPLEPDDRPHALALRYLAAFGPASTRDLQAWSGFRGLASVLDELRPQLRVFRDERRRELFDLPEAPRPSEDTPAPARFVADFDNLILSHADRTRVIADEHRPVVITKNGQVLPTFLVDGFVAGTWNVSHVRKTAIMTVSPFAPLSSAARSELAAEGETLTRFLAPDAAQFDLRFEGDTNR
jgi:Winged helix DNA-binding domain